jgi:hypothetical protein
VPGSIPRIIFGDFCKQQCIFTGLLNQKTGKKFSARNYNKQGESFYQRYLGQYADNEQTKKEYQDIY